MKFTPETVVLINCGCENIQKIANYVRSSHYYAIVMPYTVSVERLEEENPKGLIFVADSQKDFDKIAARLTQFKKLDLPQLEIISDKTGKEAGEEYSAKICKFCKDTCGFNADWTMEKFIEDSIDGVRKLVGKEKVVLALSGGVDSSVVAALLHRAIGGQLTCVFVDHGLLRKNEAKNVQEIFSRSFDMDIRYIDASEQFLGELKGVADPEEKRKIIGRVFIDIFSKEAKDTGATFLGQGTIYPDIIESIPLDGNPEGIIKSHHNVGGLPEDMKLKLVEPVARLFKDEVRNVGRILGLPTEMLDRHPFPGPSFGVRHLGPVDKKTLNILREADAIVTEELMKSGWYHKTWQAFAIFVPVKTVGIKNDKRTYDYVIAIRAVNTVDAVVAEAVELPWELLFKMSDRIIKEVDGVNRVVYDITHKPPGTIEWE